MELPVKPSEFEAVIISESDSVCDSFIKLYKFSVLAWRFYKWWHAGPADGGLSASVKAKICNVLADCEAIEDDPLTE